MRLIDADSLTVYLDSELLKAKCEGTGYLEMGARTLSDKMRCYAEGVDFAIKALKEKPTVEAELVRRGRWLAWEEQFPGEKVPKKNRLGVFCSQCHSHADNMSKRCPECGAIMDGGNEDAAD